jgi:hypothetical protein
MTAAEVPDVDLQSVSLVRRDLDMRMVDAEARCCARICARPFNK